MAGDWIKIEKVTPEKPEIIRMGVILKRDSDEIFGKLFKIWAWADDQSATGAGMLISEKFIDKKAGLRGFAKALRAVGWLVGECGNLTFPGFDRHNGETAKTRATTKNRVENHRNGNAHTVTNVTHAPLQNALPEKRREEKSVKNTPPEFCPCSIEQAISQAPVCRMTPAQAEHWWNVRNASGWTKGSTGGGTPRRITSWQSDMATSAAWVAESMAKAQGAAKLARGRIVPDIGGRKPASIANWDDARPLNPADLEEIEF